MLEQTSRQFRAKFLIEFTKHLVEISQGAEAEALEELLRKRIKENIEKKSREEQLYYLIERKQGFSESKTLPPIPEYKRRFQQMNQPMQNYSQNQQVFTPLPPTVQNIRPSPSFSSINLGKLNPLVKDPTVTAIECRGPEQNIFVRRSTEVRKTSILLNESEIDEIIRTFSEESKIPVQQGVFRVAVGSLVISAIISDVIDKKFVIEKMLS